MDDWPAARVNIYLAPTSVPFLLFLHNPTQTFSLLFTTTPNCLTKSIIMAFRSIFIALSFILTAVGAVHGTPINPRDLSSNNNTFVPRGEFFYCDEAGSTFVNQVSTASPLVDDCLNMINTIVTYDQRWVTDATSPIELIHSGTCHFNVQGEWYQHQDTYFGNGDVIHFVLDSIKRFKSNGRIGAYGVTRCRWTRNENDNDEQKSTIRWGIY